MYYRNANCAVVRNYTGHGINNLFHTAPNIPHYAKNRAIGTMKAGMCFTIEPVRFRSFNDVWQSCSFVCDR